MKKAQRVVTTYYLLSTVSRFGASFVFATYVTFLLSRGLNLLEVNMVNMVYFATILLAEIPTGAIADVLGRKVSYFCSNLLLAVGFFIYGFSGSLAGFIVAEAIAAVGRTCESGAYQSWLVDSLSHAGYEGSLNKIFSRENAMGTVAGVCASILGAMLADRNPVLPWFFAGGILLISSVLTLVLMEEEYFVRRKYSIKAKFGEMAGTVRASVRYASSNQAVRFILFLGVIQYVAIQAPNMQWQPHYLEFTHHKAFLGVIWAGIAFAVAIGGLLSGRFMRKAGGEQQALVWSQILIGAGIVLAGASRVFSLSVTIFLLHEVARGIFKPIHDVYLHDNIPSKERATIVSCGSIVRHLGGMVGLFLSGLLVVRTSIPVTWIVSGAFLVLATLLVPKNGKKH